MGGIETEAAAELSSGTSHTTTFAASGAFPALLTSFPALRLTTSTWPVIGGCGDCADT